jgi:hypothetical protein
MRQNARLEALQTLGYNNGLDCKKYSENGPVAQSVEQRIENPCVGGSIPPWATNIRKRQPFAVGVFISKCS